MRVVVYEKLWFEPVHYFLLGVEIVSNKCVDYMLVEESGANSLIKKANRNKKCFRAVSRSVHLKINNILNCCTGNSPEYGLEINISKTSSSQKHARVSSKDEFHGIVEGSDIGYIDDVSQFSDELLTVFAVSLKLTLLL